MAALPTNKSLQWVCVICERLPDYCRWCLFRLRVFDTGCGCSLAQGKVEHQQRQKGFTFLGHQFRKQLVKVKDGSLKLLYTTSIAPKAKQRILAQVKDANCTGVPTV